MLTYKCIQINEHQKSDQVLNNNRQTLCVGETYDELDVVTVMSPEMLDGLTDEEDIDDEELYGVESLPDQLELVCKILTKN